jgi:hypothetical protein
MVNGETYGALEDMAVLVKVGDERQKTKQRLMGGIIKAISTWLCSLFYILYIPSLARNPCLTAMPKDPSKYPVSSLRHFARHFNDWACSGCGMQLVRMC